MTISQVLQRVLERFKITQPSARHEADILLAFVLNQPGEYLYTHPEHNISHLQIKKFESLLSRRLKGWPIAYLVGRKDFYNLSFIVSPAVLIPRPDSEILIDLVKQNPIAHKRQVLIADIGTGSGNIAITLARGLPAAQIIASDISLGALRIAKLNARRYKLLRRIHFYHGSLLSPMRRRQMDIVVANLPYLTNYQIRHSPTPEIKSEPTQALAGGRRGFEIIHKLLRQITTYRLSPQLIVLEIDPSQTKLLREAVRRNLSEYNATVLPDYGGIKRFGVLTKR